MSKKLKNTVGFVFSKRTIWTAGVVAVGWWIVLAYGFGWSSPGTQRAGTAQALVQYKAEICQAQFSKHPNAAANYAAFAKESRDYDKKKVVEASGANIMPGASGSEYAVDEACVANIEKAGPPKMAAAAKQ